MIVFGLGNLVTLDLIIFIDREMAGSTLVLCLKLGSHVQ